MKNAVVIGSGIGGLAAAVRLAVKGYETTVVEQNAYPGGKLTTITKNGFRFDAGPSLFTMPELVDELFALAGKNARDYFTYQKLDTLCHYFYEDGTRIMAHSDVSTFAQEVAAKTGESEQTVIKHLEKSRFIYDTTSTLFLTKSLHRWQTYASVNTLVSALKIPFLNIFKTMDEVNQIRFTNAKLVQLFNRYATYNGSSPYKAPGILNIIPHLEFNQGAYLPKNGMHDITDSIYRLAKELGVQFRFNEPAIRIEVKNKAVHAVHTASSIYPADVLVCNGDIHSVYKTLMPQEKKLKQVDSQERSSSALIFYWGMASEFPELDVHNIFFSNDYEREFDAIFNTKSVMDDPTVYVNITSKRVSSDAPSRKENWFVMINVPADYNQDWNDIIARSRENIIKKLSRMLNRDIEPLIECEEILTPRLIEQRTHSYKGSLYGTASNNRFAAFFRHKNFSSVHGLYFCGGSVHPGGGIPLALSSAKIVDRLIKTP